LTVCRVLRQKLVAHPAVEAFAKAVCISFPGAMKCQAIWLFSDQAGMALQVNSAPLPHTIMPGLRRRSINADRSRATPPSRDGVVRNRRQAFLADVIDDIQDPEAASISELVVMAFSSSSSGECRLVSVRSIAV
jgi:hypothetical protein